MAFGFLGDAFGAIGSAVKDVSGFVGKNAINLAATGLGVATANPVLIAKGTGGILSNVIGGGSKTSGSVPSYSNQITYSNDLRTPGVTVQSRTPIATGSSAYSRTFGSTGASQRIIAPGPPAGQRAGDPVFNYQESLEKRNDFFQNTGKDALVSAAEELVTKISNNQSVTKKSNLENDVKTILSGALSGAAKNFLRTDAGTQVKDNAIMDFVKKNWAKGVLVVLGFFGAIFGIVKLSK